MEASCVLAKAQHQAFSGQIQDITAMEAGKHREQTRLTHFKCARSSLEVPTDTYACSQTSSPRTG